MVCSQWGSRHGNRYFAALSFFLAFFSFTVSLGLFVVLDFSWPLGIVKSSLRKPKWRALSEYSLLAARESTEKRQVQARSRNPSLALAAPGQRRGSMGRKSQRELRKLARIQIGDQCITKVRVAP